MSDQGSQGFDLGPLEADVMRLVWEMGEVQVDEVHRVLQGEREIAYTTVMTVMSRLAVKGLLERRKDGRAYRYTAAVEREQVAQSSLKDWADRFFGGSIAPAASFLVGSGKLTEGDRAELRRLLDEAEEKGER